MENELILLVIALSVSGLLAGIIAGLLGVGGGIVMVPILFQTFVFLDVPASAQIHLSIGTSLAIISLTAMQSTRAHAKTGAVDFDILYRWAVPVIIGAGLGAYVARLIPAETLKGFFAIVVLILGLRMLIFPGAPNATARQLSRMIQALSASFIGFCSALMGIGGGTFSVPLLGFMGRTVHQSVATSSGIGVLIAIPAAIGFIWAGWGVQGLPKFSYGYVNALAFAIMIPTTLIGAPIGARLAHKLDKRVLQLFFAAFLLLTSARMFLALNP
jgi:uncharacterized membrane protein YfcA